MESESIGERERMAIPVNAALLVVDVQMGMFDPEACVAGHENLLSTLGDLVARARAGGTLVVYVQHCGPHGHRLERGTPGWEIHPAVRPSGGDWIVEKMEPEAFHDSTLHSRLRDQEIGCLIITGIATEYCVDSTVRGAYRLGYEVVLVEDGHTTWGHEGLSASQIVDHHNRTLQRFGKVLKAADLKF